MGNINADCGISKMKNGQSKGSHGEPLNVLIILCLIFMLRLFL